MLGFLFSNCVSSVCRWFSWERVVWERPPVSSATWRTSLTRNISQLSRLEMGALVFSISFLTTHFVIFSGVQKTKFNRSFSELSFIFHQFGSFPRLNSSKSESVIFQQNRLFNKIVRSVRQVSFRRICFKKSFVR